MGTGTVRVGGADLQYVREGHGDPVLVIGSATYYPKAFSRQLRNHFDLIFADSRHFVPSYAPASEQLETLTLDTFADDVDAVRRHLGVEHMAVLGHSIHAQIAIAYARRYPHRTSHLILVAGVPYAFSEFSDEADRFFQAEASPERKEILARNTKDLEALLTTSLPNRSFVVAYQARGALYWADPRYDAASLLEGLENGPAFNRLFVLVPSRSEVRGSLQEVKAPTLLVLGKLDFAIPYTTWQQLIAGVANVRCVVLNQDSHNPQTEAQERCDPVLIEWLRAKTAAV